MKKKLASAVWVVFPERTPLTAPPKINPHTETPLETRRTSRDRRERESQGERKNLTSNAQPVQRETLGRKVAFAQFTNPQTS